ncbi:MAG: methyltransferase domain-containing protein [Candidatus Nitricoxidivorans perseverans]|uniref:Methyltransferase domain-containing protein n=1 Tax=Candidatus Nitricoxidivorans perseverans TaxID=2975601 RepID=A0AA49FKF2_9PROT|nr:MAG: methyltransferase domain-containing protein [Candidatus Nitricoxidivorans perseverans]
MRPGFSASAGSYDEAAALARETGRRMAKRLDFVNLSPRRMADVGCATGDGIRELQRRYPRALPLAVDFAFPMLAAVRSRMPLLARLRGMTPRLVNADVRTLPLASGCLDLAWSNLMLHWLDDPLPAFAELNRALAPGGLLTFAMLGPDTLKELRAAGATGIRRFPDMHDVGDLLLAAGFADPVTDMEMIALTYASPRGLLRDQRHLGVRDGLLGHLPRRDWRRVFDAWERVDGRLPASFEIIYGHAWKGERRAILGQPIHVFRGTRHANLPPRDL